MKGKQDTDYFEFPQDAHKLIRNTVCSQSIF